MNWFSKRLISWYCSHCDTHLTKKPHSILEILMEIHSTFTWLIYWKVNKDTPLLLQLRLYALLNTDTSIYWFLSLIVVLQEMKWNEMSRWNLIIDTHLLRYSPTAGTTPAAITYGTHKDSSSTEMTGAASLPMMNWRSILRIPFA